MNETATVDRSHEKRPRFNDSEQRIILGAVATYRRINASDRDIDRLFAKLLRAWDDPSRAKEYE